MLGYRGSEYEDYGRVGCGVVWVGRYSWDVHRLFCRTGYCFRHKRIVEYSYVCTEAIYAIKYVHIIVIHTHIYIYIYISFYGAEVGRNCRRLQSGLPKLLATNVWRCCEGKEGKCLLTSVTNMKLSNLKQYLPIFKLCELCILHIFAT
jgi:hypothetical protein